MKQPPPNNANVSRTIVWAADRVFVTPAPGCPAACAFCYLPTSGCDKPNPQALSAETIVSAIQTSPFFHPGPTGTLISIGCYSEALAPHSLSSTLSFFEALSSLTNPVQLATRWIIDGQSLDRFLDAARAIKLVVFHSFSNLTRLAEIEKGTPSVERRVAFIGNCRNAGIVSVLYIKPFLPGLTVLSKYKVIQLAQRFDIKYVVVGPLFMDETIRKSLGSVLPLPTLNDYFGVGRVPVSPPDPDEFGKSNPEVAEFIDALVQAGILVEHHGSAVSRRLALGANHASR